MVKSCGLTFMAGFLVLTAWLAVFPSGSWAVVRLPKIFGDHMVLQRNATLPLWGWADAGEEIIVSIGEQRVTTTADSSGQWKVSLAALREPGPYSMTVTGANNSVQFSDILVGEVWFCSGQSNMEWQMNNINQADAEKAAAQFPNIRLFHVPKKAVSHPESDVDASWKACTPEEIPTFSAVAYFFGREIHEKVKVPVGLINCSWGGTRIEPWTPPVGFDGIREVADILTVVQQADSQHKQAVNEALKQYDQWLASAKETFAKGSDVEAPPAWPAHPLSSHVAPTSLYNGMVHPLVPFAIRGAIWYQGESNHQEGLLYTWKMKALVEGWRKVWGQGDFPFYYVQLAPYRYQDPNFLPLIWEAQQKAMDVISKSGMAVVTDLVDNVADIHPRNKKDVGKRLALWALKNEYGQSDLPASGPVYQKMEIEGYRIRLHFTSAEGGLKTRDGKPLDSFMIAGEDKQFVPAMADFEGENIISVASESIVQPVAVRFGWNQEAMPNLINGAGLPASPFRTDNW
ncbi:MAG TPA: sialate O-acetylesterase [bacterium]|nr:sialate O-acetylesterase [bacterium]